jgi:aromatic-L-amino-acid decarboxylase
MHPSHMSSQEFREMGRRAIDWIADYWERVESLPVHSTVPPGQIAASLPEHAPEQGGEAAWEDIFADLDRVVLPGVTHWQHPSFFAFFSANASAPAVIAEAISAGLGVQGMLWTTSPACTEMEQRMLDWLGELVGLPEQFLWRGPSGQGGGVIEGTASESTLVAMLAARDSARAALRAAGESDSLDRLVCYASNQAHSSVVKAAMIAGLARGPEDRNAVRLIGVDETFRMRPDLLAKAMDDDAKNGRVPIFVCATVGTTGVTAVDPVDRIAAETESRGGVWGRPWLHVDAAHAGAACICPEMRWIFDGIEHADSLCFNPHKWLLVNFDCGCFWTRRRSAITDALSITPEYLRNAASDSGQVADLRDWQVPLGRRFRALKLWMVLRRYGAEGLRGYIREHLRLASLLESWVCEDARFELAAPCTMNLVCFRLRHGDNAANTALMERVNATGRAYLTHTVLPPQVEGQSGAVALRLAVSGAFTQERHVREVWDLVREQAG